MQRSRRWFLRAGALWSSAVVACRGRSETPPPEPRALGTAVSSYGSRSRFEKTTRYFTQNTKVPLEETASRTPLHDTYGIITHRLCISSGIIRASPRSIRPRIR